MPGKQTVKRRHGKAAPENRVRNIRIASRRGIPSEELGPPRLPSELASHVRYASFVVVFGLVLIIMFSVATPTASYAIQLSGKFGCEVVVSDSCYEFCSQMHLSQWDCDVTISNEPVDWLVCACGDSGG